MTDREKVIRGLECHVNGHPHTRCHKCPYWGTGPHGGSECNVLAADALALLKKSFIPKEVYDVVVEHAQHDTRFKLGDKIDYSFSDVVDILNIELMCKAGDM